MRPSMTVHGDDIARHVSNAIRDLPPGVREFARRRCTFIGLGSETAGGCLPPLDRYLIVVRADQTAAEVKRTIRHELAHAVLMDDGEMMDHLDRPPEEAEWQVEKQLAVWKRWARK